MKICTEYMLPLNAYSRKHFAEVCEGETFIAQDDEDKEMWMKVGLTEVFNLTTNRLCHYPQVAVTPMVYVVPMEGEVC